MLAAERAARCITTRLWLRAGHINHLEGGLTMAKPDNHDYYKMDDGRWKCWVCEDIAPPAEHPPCKYCGARLGDACRLQDCIKNARPNPNP